MRFTAGNFSLFKRAATISAVVSVLLIAGCQDEAPDESESIAALLAAVPAETPYFGANLHFMPDDVYQHQMKLLAPRIADVVDVFGQVVMSDTKADAEDKKKGEAFFATIANFFRDEANWKQQRGVVYGIGVFPVLRLELEDPAATLQDLNKLHQDLGVTPDKAAGLGDNVFSVVKADEPVGLYYGIVEGYFIGTILPTDDAQSQAVAFGQTAPTNVIDPASLEQMAQTRGYGPGVLGFLDILKTYDAIMDENSGLLAKAQERLAADGDIDLDDISAECRTELREMAAIMPRMEWGTTYSTKDGVGSSSHFQLRQDIAEGLMAMTGDLAGLDQDPGTDMAFAASFRIGPMRDFVLQMARNIQADPFECEYLLTMNLGADEILAQAGTPIPPFAGQVRGFKLSMNGLAAMSVDQPPDMSLALFVDNAQLLMSMMQLFLPQLAETPLQPDGQPVRIDEQLSGIAPTTPGTPIFAALTETAIGVSMGQAQVEQLPAMMAESDGEGGILFASWVDYGAIMELQRQMQEKMENAMAEELEMDAMEEEFDEEFDDEFDGEDSGANDDAMAEMDEEGGDDDALDAETRALYEAQSELVMEKVMAIYEVLGRAGGQVRPTADGLIIEQDITFKK